MGIEQLPGARVKNDTFDTCRQIFNLTEYEQCIAHKTIISVVSYVYFAVKSVEPHII